MSRSAFSEVELARSPCSGDVPSDMKSQSRVIPACFRTIRTLAGASAQFFRSGRARTGMRTATDVGYRFLGFSGSFLRVTLPAFGLQTIQSGNPGFPGEGTARMHDVWKDMFVLAVPLLEK